MPSRFQNDQKTWKCGSSSIRFEAEEDWFLWEKKQAKDSCLCSDIHVSIGKKGLLFTASCCVTSRFYRSLRALYPLPYTLRFLASDIHFVAHGRSRKGTCLTSKWFLYPKTLNGAISAVISDNIFVCRTYQLCKLWPAAWKLLLFKVGRVFEALQLATGALIRVFGCYVCLII